MKVGPINTTSQLNENERKKMTLIEAMNIASFIITTPRCEMIDFNRIDFNDYLPIIEKGISCSHGIQVSF